jgi:hypothetical protein
MVQIHLNHSVRTEPVEVLLPMKAMVERRNPSTGSGRTVNHRLRLNTEGSPPAPLGHGQWFVVAGWLVEYGF